MRYRGFTLIELIIVAAIMFIFVSMLYSAMNEAKHGGCAQYEKTGRTICETHHPLDSKNSVTTITTCDEEKRCVKFKDGTTP